MPEVELGKYAFSVLSAWGMSLAALLLLGLVTWRQSLRARRALHEVPLDPDAAQGVCESDDIVDRLNEQIFRELLTYMMENPANISRALGLILIARYLERIADHATNISEMVIYLVKGKDIRHTHVPDRPRGSA